MLLSDLVQNLSEHKSIGQACREFIPLILKYIFIQRSSYSFQKK